eukprot:TRINITY_DN1614_c0_g1_i1.p2 TRINITY_DN1614_c0_g1~~TRINITY_DN1614_c0_g1_i1.p2  ORF type:complete len:160 (+),score=54.62 TRINITY_DN1614_c0_g1_i1:54-533(+)
MKRKLNRRLRRLQQHLRSKGIGTEGDAPHLKRKRPDGTLKGVTICQCGIDFPAGVHRKEVEKDMLLAGAQLTPHPKKCTHLLLLPDGAGKKKHTEAVERGAVVITYKQLLTMMVEPEQRVEGQAPRKKLRTNAGKSTAGPAERSNAAWEVDPADVAFRI